MNKTNNNTTELQLLSEKQREVNTKHITKILITKGFKLTHKLEKQESFSQNAVFLATDEIKTAYICADSQLYEETVNHFWSIPKPSSSVPNVLSISSRGLTLKRK